MTTPTEVRTPTDHRPEVVTVIAHMRAKPGKEQDLRDARRAQELQDRLRDAAEAYAAGAITLAQLTAINAAIKPKLEEAQTVAASPNRTKVLGDLVAAPDPVTVWESFTRPKTSRGRAPGRGKHYADPSRATVRPGGNQDHLEVMTERGT